MFQELHLNPQLDHKRLIMDPLTDNERVGRFMSFTTQNRCRPFSTIQVGFTTN